MGIERSGRTPKVRQAALTTRKGSLAMRIRVFLLGLGLVAASITASTAVAGNLLDSASSLLVTIAGAAVQAVARPGEVLPRSRRLVRGRRVRLAAERQRRRRRQRAVRRARLQGRHLARDPERRVGDHARHVRDAAPSRPALLRAQQGIAARASCAWTSSSTLRSAWSRSRSRWFRRGRPGRRRCRCRSSPTRSRWSARTARPASRSLHVDARRLVPGRRRLRRPVSQRVTG